jgi:hypothetical protein
MEHSAQSCGVSRARRLHEWERMVEDPNIKTVEVTTPRFPYGFDKDVELTRPFVLEDIVQPIYRLLSPSKMSSCGSPEKLLLLAGRETRQTMTLPQLSQFNSQVSPDVMNGASCGKVNVYDLSR